MRFKPVNFKDNVPFLISSTAVAKNSFEGNHLMTLDNPTKISTFDWIFIEIG